MKSHMLETEEITVDHMAVNLSNYLKKALNLASTQIGAAVTDNASNITAAINAY